MKVKFVLIIVLKIFVLHAKMENANFVIKYHHLIPNLIKITNAKVHVNRL